jgi:hypothetical protein
MRGTARIAAIAAATAAGGVAGLVLGFLATLVWCDWFYPGSNTCGFAAVFYAFPLGAAPGAFIAFLIARRLMPSHDLRA